MHCACAQKKSRFVSSGPRSGSPTLLKRCKTFSPAANFSRRGGGVQVVLSVQGTGPLGPWVQWHSRKGRKAASAKNICNIALQHSLTTCALKALLDYGGVLLPSSVLTTPHSVRCQCVCSPIDTAVIVSLCVLCIWIHSKKRHTQG